LNLLVGARVKVVPNAGVPVSKEEVLSD